MRKSPGLEFIGLVGLLLLLVLSACQQQGGQTGGQPSFNIALGSASLNVTQGGSGSTTLTLTPQNGFSGTVNLSAVNPPSGITVSFNPNPLNVPSQTQSTVTVQVGQSVNPGNYTLTLQAQGGGVTRTASLSVTVQASGGGGGGGGTGTNWTYVWTHPIHSVAYGNNTFVAVGDSGLILTSRDGIAWTRQVMRMESYTLEGVIYANNIFVAVGSGGTILTSPDGARWTRQNSGTTSYLTDVTYGNGLFVAVGDGGTILTSQNTQTWQQVQNVPTTALLRDVAYGNGLFVAVGDGGTILTSQNGTNWTQRTSPTTAGFYAITHGNNLFVIVGQHGYVLTSQDGTSWTARTQAQAGYVLRDVIYANGRFIASGYKSVGCCDKIITPFFTSDDGLTWTVQNWDTVQSLGVVVSVTGLAYGGGTVVAVGEYGAVLTSSDEGRNWTVQRIRGFEDVFDVIYANGKFWAVEAFFGWLGVPAVLSSLDGVNWELHPTPPYPNVGNEYTLYGLAYGSNLNRFVAVGTLSRYGGVVILTSEDGVHWSFQNPGNFGSRQLHDVIYAGSPPLFVAVGTDGLILTSPDGLQWTVRNSSGGGGSLRRVTYGNGTFVAVGYDDNSRGIIFISQDGQTWQQVQNVPPVELLDGVTYGTVNGTGTFVAVGCGILISQDNGQTWQQVQTNYCLQDVAYGNGTFVAVTWTWDDDGVILTSQNGVNWTVNSGLRRANGAPLGLERVRYANGTFVVGGGGVILLSTSP